MKDLHKRLPLSLSRSTHPPLSELKKSLKIRSRHHDPLQMSTPTRKQGPTYYNQQDDVPKGGIRSPRLSSPKPIAEIPSTARPRPTSFQVASSSPTHLGGLHRAQHRRGGSNRRWQRSRRHCHCCRCRHPPRPPLATADSAMPRLGSGTRGLRRVHQRSKMILLCGNGEARRQALSTCDPLIFLGYPNEHFPI